MELRAEGGQRPRIVWVVFTAVLSNAALCGGGGENGKRRFCNCAFDCLTEEGIRYHNVILSGQ